jgi:hypothetical protein
MCLQQIEGHAREHALRAIVILQLIGYILVLSAAHAWAQWIPSDRERDKAANEIRRLPPSAFTILPRAIIEDLNRRQCTIPQIDGDAEPHNVIKGSFTGKGQTDWAALCSRGGESSILVFKGGSTRDISQLANEPDKGSLQVITDGRIGYSRMISPADGANILRHYEAYGGPKPPPIDHQGIEDIFVEKASVILYFYQGSWLRLTGAD